MDNTKKNILNFINSPKFDRAIGKNWYEFANSDLIDILYKLNLDKYITIYEVCLICSILSPANKWRTNLEDTYNILNWYFRDKLDIDKKPVFYTYGNNINKSLTYLKDRINFRLLNPHLDTHQVYRNFTEVWVNNNMKTQKTYNFYKNLCNPKYIDIDGKYFTIDRHMLKISGINKPSLTIKQYNELKKIFFEVYKESKIECLFHEFQAILWSNYIYLNKGILHY